jgi:hypothetical protein
MGAQRSQPFPDVSASDQVSEPGVARGLPAHVFERDRPIMLSVDRAIDKRHPGQEAAAVLISMASSSADDAPRGIDFLFSRNRLDVALSRARCLSGAVL